MRSKNHDTNPSHNGKTATRSHSLAYLLALAVGCFCVVSQLMNWEPALRFDREAIHAGQWWRILTANLVHLGYGHLLLNLMGLTVITLLLAPALSVGQWALTGLISMLGVGVGLLLFEPQLQWYVGLSGALYGLLLGGAIAEFRFDRFPALVIGIYTVAKVVWEQLYGALESSERISGGTVIVNAHLYGMIAGAFTVSLILAYQTYQKAKHATRDKPANTG